LRPHRLLFPVLWCGLSFLQMSVSSPPEAEVRSSPPLLFLLLRLRLFSPGSSFLPHVSSLPCRQGLFFLKGVRRSFRVLLRPVFSRSSAVHGVHRPGGPSNFALASFRIPFFAFFCVFVLIFFPPRLFQSSALSPNYLCVRRVTAFCSFLAPLRGIDLSPSLPRWSHSTTRPPPAKAFPFFSSSLLAPGHPSYCILVSRDSMGSFLARFFEREPEG